MTSSPAGLRLNASVHFRTIIRLLKFSLTAAILLSVLSACEPDTAIYVTVDDNMPPTFSFSGKWWAVDFLVAELPPKGSYSQTNPVAKYKTLWKVSTPSLLRAKNWPQVTYGVVPEGFSQKVPAHGKPPDLVEGKIYVALALDTSETGGAYYFQIKNGKPVQVAESELFDGETATNKNNQTTPQP